jgi:hypothetical protein
MKSTLHSRSSRLLAALLVPVVAAFLGACTGGSVSGLPIQPTPITAPRDDLSTASTPAPRRDPSPTPSPARPTTRLPTPPDPAATTSLDFWNAVLVGAGDIASCDYDTDEQTARLLDNIEGSVFTLGDNVHDDGKSSEFRQCYEPTWGRHKDRTYPAPGNHDYRTGDAAPYYDYFGDVAGDPTRGWYSYDLGAWHIVVLNSNCGSVGGCDSDSEQVRWLRADLEAHPTPCTLAYWHHPRFSAGKYRDDPDLRPFWQALYDAGADVVLAGHDHNYQRYALQDPDGATDPAIGIRQFVVGTGGKSLYDLERDRPNLEAANDSAHGVLKLTLYVTGYAWEFIPVVGDSFTDSGSAMCH